MRKAKFSEINTLIDQGYKVEIKNGQPYTEATSSVKSNDLISLEQNYIALLQAYSLAPSSSFGEIMTELETAESGSVNDSERIQVLKHAAQIKAVADQIRVLGSKPHLATGEA